MPYESQILDVIIKTTRVATNRRAKKGKDMPYKLNLQLFEDAGAGETVTTEPVTSTAEPDTTSTDTSTTVAAGDQTATGTDGNNNSDESFESLISGKYKTDYEKALKGTIGKRFRNQQNLQSRIDSVNPVIQEMAHRYGVQPGKDGAIPIEDLKNAMLNDDKAYEQEAFDRGMKIEDLKHMRQLEIENQTLTARNEQTADQHEWDVVQSQGEALKQTYPDFDLEHELSDPGFGRLLATLQHNGFPDAVRTAYETTHRDQILAGSMKYAVQHTQEQISKSIQSGIKRPTENGTSNGQPANTGKIDPSKLSESQIKEYIARAKRGESITFM